MLTGANWSAALGEVVGTLLRRGLGPPTTPLADPQAAEARRFQRLRRALRDSGDERRQLRAPEPAPLLEQGGLVRPPPTLIWMGLVPVLDGPLLMMASFSGTRVVCVPLGSVPYEESKTCPLGACKVRVILFC